MIRKCMLACQLPGSALTNPTTLPPFTAATDMVPSDGPIFEFACHEGNYGLASILAGRPRRGTRGPPMLQ